MKWSCPRTIFIIDNRVRSLYVEINRVWTRSLRTGPISFCYCQIFVPYRNRVSLVNKLSVEQGIFRVTIFHYHLSSPSDHFFILTVHLSSFLTNEIYDLMNVLKMFRSVFNLLCSFLLSSNISDLSTCLFLHLNTAERSENKITFC